MNKTQLIKKVAEESGLTRIKAAAVVENVFSTIVDSVAAGESVSVLGFGTFEKKHRGARLGRNPLTGEPMEFAASDTPVFKAGKAFKDKVNG
ncbi:MAG: HU family DNA-binding protein [Oscillospiraceae bacterium]|nr:HU family DNA-binding protein [Oscillospiraceae bacterium]MBP5169801.1 HU family DNA-binding protein [Oscillospiraceae bacterium]